MKRVGTFLVWVAFIGLSISANAQSIVDTGSCGASLTWKLYSNDSLSISGSGVMTDYDNISNLAALVFLSQHDKNACNGQ